VLQARASSNAPSNVRAWTLQTSQCRQQNESLQCNFSVFQYDLWGRSRAINKSAAFTLDGLSEARSYKVCTIAASQSALSWKAIKMCATVLMLSMCPRPCNASAQLQRAQCRI